MTTTQEAAAATALRNATPDDAEAMARPIDRAGEGIPTHLWRLSAGAGETPLEVGRSRAQREEGGFSYRNAVMAEAGGRVAGMLLDYRQPDPYDPGDLDAMPAIVRPLAEFEALAPGSWYINALAVFDEYEGRGIGRALLAEAERRAAASGADALSLIVAEANDRARGLYLRNGYAERARRPTVPFEDFVHEGDWLLLVKELAE